jgi:hypothetical protein
MQFPPSLLGKCTTAVQLLTWGMHAGEFRGAASSLFPLVQYSTSHSIASGLHYAYRRCELLRHIRRRMTPNGTGILKVKRDPQRRRRAEPGIESLRSMGTRPTTNSPSVLPVRKQLKLRILKSSVEKQLMLRLAEGADPGLQTENSLKPATMHACSLWTNPAGRTARLRIR